MREQLPLSDAHAHLSVEDAAHELASRLERNILTCFSTGTPAEWEQVRRLVTNATSEGSSTLFPVSFGIHPWEAAKYVPHEFEEAYEQCAAIGEIGLDTVWCDVPLARQSTIFEGQLRIAADRHKPIVLHTKGAEERIADMIEGFPERVLVHWYSGPLTAFESFADQGCYFTLGPDCTDGSELNHVMMAALPQDRILIETDGIEGVRWAIEQNPSLAKRLANYRSQGDSLVEATLKASASALAQVRNLTSYDAALSLRRNMEMFYSIR